jgi:glutathione synthase/RimK-type ligase-like ATP-grasp enzyme
MEIIVKLDVHNIPKEERIAGIAKSPEQLLKLTKGFSDEDLFFQESLGKLDIVYKVYVIDDYAVSIIRKNRLRKYNLSPLQLVYMRAPIEKKLKKRILKIGEELRMPIYGVDYVEKNGTPYIVDVNNFPSYRNIPEALSLISDHIYNVLNISDYHYDLMKTITV